MDEKEQHKAMQACREIERMKRECVKAHANEDDNDDYEGHEDDEESKDDEDHDDHDGEITSEDDDDDDDNVGAFINEVEGGVPSAPHSTLIKKLHILNQTPTYRRSVIEKDEIDLLIKKLLEMKLRGEIGGKPCGLGTSCGRKLVLRANAIRIS